MQRRPISKNFRWFPVSVDIVKPLLPSAKRDDGLEKAYLLISKILMFLPFRFSRIVSSRLVLALHSEGSRCPLFPSALSLLSRVFCPNGFSNLVPSVSIPQINQQELT